MIEAMHQHGTLVVEKKGPLTWEARVDITQAWLDTDVKGPMKIKSRGISFYAMSEGRAKQKAQRHFLALMKEMVRTNYNSSCSFHWSADFC